MAREDNVIVPRWFLENVEDTLRIQNNINLDKTTGETCQDRNVRQSLNGLRKLLKGDELSGMERLEKLQPSLPSNLDEAAEEYSRRLDYYHYTGDDPSIAFKAGAEWMAGQGVKAHCVESSNPVSDSKDENLHLITLVYAENENTPYVLAGDEVEIILRKKQ